MNDYTFLALVCVAAGIGLFLKGWWEESEWQAELLGAGFAIAGFGLVFFPISFFLE